MHQQHDGRDADHEHPLPDADADVTARQTLDRKNRDVPAVEDRDRQPDSAAMPIGPMSSRTGVPSGWKKPVTVGQGAGKG